MAQSLSLPVRISAQIIPLPTAALQPVQQQRGPGRRPSSIVNLRRWKCDHVLSIKTPPVIDQSNWRQTKAAEIARTIEIFERALMTERSKLNALTSVN